MKQSPDISLEKHALLVEHLVLKYNTAATFFREKIFQKAGFLADE